MDVQLQQPAIPANLASLERVILRGTFRVSVVSIRDVGQSVPQKNPAAGEEAPAEPRAKPTRMFKLLLSDGAHEAVAMEYEPSPALDGVRAGSQLFLADVFALRGMLLLTPRCIKSVG